MFDIIPLGDQHMVILAEMNIVKRVVTIMNEFKEYRNLCNKIKHAALQKEMITIIIEAGAISLVSSCYVEPIGENEECFEIITSSGSLSFAKTDNLLIQYDNLYESFTITDGQITCSII